MRLAALSTSLCGLEGVLGSYQFNGLDYWGLGGYSLALFAVEKVDGRRESRPVNTAGVWSCYVYRYMSYTS